MNILIDAGPYVAELLYEIVVENRPKPELKGSVGFQPPRNLAIIKRIVEERKKKGEITENQGNKILDAILTLNPRKAQSRK